MENFEARFNGSGVAVFAPQQAEQNFGMEVLADFVDDANILQQRLRFITGKRNGLISLQRARLGVVEAAVAASIATARGPSR